MTRNRITTWLLHGLSVVVAALLEETVTFPLRRITVLILGLALLPVGLVYLGLMLLGWLWLLPVQVHA